MTVKSCLKSMRLRTLPLSLAGIIAGISLASACGPLDVPTVTALVLTTVFLQILSNLSNELGDTLHGTDTEERAGMHYSLQDGEMTIPQMKRLIAVIAALCCISGLAMIYFSFGTLLAFQPAALILLGAAAIWAAMHYTLGKNPYGYRGLGDIFVFIFFGLVATLGAAYVCSHSFSPMWLLPAAAFGLWSVGVLNVNNIRDMITDAATRTTVAIRLGARNARIYHSLLLGCGWVLMLAYTILTSEGLFSYLYVLVIPLTALHLKAVWTRSGRALDPMLPMLVMTTFAVALLFTLGNCIG
ncbi:MAG: 1,4-dihydroxy-2-naphthoate octaprenyltransferase [Bacteroidales bacterium]|nr:1,4-dihydroxy-2-naphthoate octaprenyltransferase [Bacteroidales bacterium]